MKINVYDEMIFSTARSGGKGGQNVNKVETMVEARWNVASSKHVNDEQKQLLLNKLANKINSEGFLITRAQEARTQLENKSIVVNKLSTLLEAALVRKKSRIATRPTKAAYEKRIFSKKTLAERKTARQKLRPHHY